MEDNGQIVMFEGCLMCSKTRLDHSPIKIPRSEWDRENNAVIPTLTRYYDFACYDCARAILAPCWDILAWLYRRRHGLKRLSMKDIKCPKIQTT